MKVSLLRVLLFAALAASLFWLNWSRFDELAYHYRKPQKIILGDALSWPQDKPLPLEQYVEITGILGAKAALINGLREGAFRFGPLQIRQIVGTSIFIEYDQAQYAGRFQPYKRVRVEGRLVDFGPQNEMKKVRDFFESHYGIKVPTDARLLVVDEVPGKYYRYYVIPLICLMILMFSFYYTFIIPLRRKKEDQLMES